MLGVSRSDRIRNGILRGKTGLKELRKGACELKWKRAGHVGRTEEERWARNGDMLAAKGEEAEDKVGGRHTEYSGQELGKTGQGEGPDSSAVARDVEKKIQMYVKMHVPLSVVSGSLSFPNTWTPPPVICAHTAEDGAHAPKHVRKAQGTIR
ncbi:hypothetical protein AAG570_011720 [Ranatra chinensis]|uniref:Uncharacterized protein n=1 Tax=Ranatra chinensis TaxID=642074 RepID=A0ABD0YGT3_9HEMI